MNIGSFETIKVETLNRLGIISLNRPEVLNAVNSRMITEINTILSDWGNEAKIRVIILTAAEKGFCSGADLKESRQRTLKEEIAFLRSFTNLVLRLENLNKPVIAAIDGRALGGGLELVLGCDIILATGNSTFGFPEINVGVIPGAGGTQRLPRIIGRMKAKELLFTGRSISAMEAEKLGLLNMVVTSKEALITAYMELGNELAEKAPIALRQDKNLVNKGTELPLEISLCLEQEAGTVVNVSEDRKEGINAFNEKRKPQFKGE